MGNHRDLSLFLLGRTAQPHASMWRPACRRSSSHNGCMSETTRQHKSRRALDFPGIWFLGVSGQCGVKGKTPVVPRRAANTSVSGALSIRRGRGSGWRMGGGEVFCLYWFVVVVRVVCCSNNCSVCRLPSRFPPFSRRFLLCFPSPVSCPCSWWRWVAVLFCACPIAPASWF